MREFKKGEKVRVDDWYYVADPTPDDTGSILLGPRNAPDVRVFLYAILPYTVPVADLEEELDGLWDLYDRTTKHGSGIGGAIDSKEWLTRRRHLRRLRDARLSAKGPKEVWVRCEPIEHTENYLYRHRTGVDVAFCPHPDDVREDGDPS